MLALALARVVCGNDETVPIIDQALAAIKEHSGYDVVRLHLNSGAGFASRTAGSAEEPRVGTLCGGDCRAFGSVTYVPVRARGETIGYLELCDQKPDVFDLDTILFLEEVGSCLGEAIVGRRSMSDVIRANMALERFASSVAHDLRGPIAAAALAGEMMETLLEEAFVKGIVPELSEQASAVGRHLARAAALVESMLTMSGVGRKPDPLYEVDVSAVLAEVLDEQSPGITTRGIRVMVDEEIGTVHASSTHVYQLLSNLVGNAIRHNDSRHPVVEIRRLANDGWHGFLVRDNGSSGPRRRNRNTLLPVYTSKRRSGTGTGLQTVRAILQVYGGRLETYSDRGTCYEVLFPETPAGALYPVMDGCTEGPGSVRPAA